MTVNLPGRRLGQGSLVRFISQLLLEVHRRGFGLALRCREMILWIRFYGYNLGTVWPGQPIHYGFDSVQSNNEMLPHYAGLGQISQLHHIQVILCCTSLLTLAMPDG
ncbi:hypothetical protein BGAL_0006g00680 [Botrytis galanthina]|uniref:Uncharacterized protein n=1 Tax=Botrytis galanthina TaxID=278940 RepID=A0A4S8RPA5_9HELO|nr:hypothetical protein BGAL_0006g00680 [Botrytis galanthina]